MASSELRVTCYHFEQISCSAKTAGVRLKVQKLMQYNNNIRSIQANLDNLVQFLNNLNYPFRSSEQISNLDLPGYSFLSQSTTQAATKYFISPHIILFLKHISENSLAKESF